MILTQQQYAFHSMVAQSTQQYQELAKRLRFSPFSSVGFKWLLVYENGPHFFVVRDMLRFLEMPFTLIQEPPQMIPNTLILTPWSQYTDSGDVKIRGQLLPADKMPLYVEAGEWDAPQCNPVFDWTEEQAWTYLIDRGLINLETK